MKRFLFILTSVTLASLVHVYAEVEAVKTGYRIRKQEEAKMMILDRSRALRYSIAHLKAPHNLERKLSAQRIALASPQSWKTLVIPARSGQSRAAVQKHAPGAPFFTRFFVGTAQAEAKE
ncbi:MAG: hypothetical protein HY592_00680 [Candidatus Omnitrophica bacterium]|nr:hypothetical protein [Candidatus Omnitrophota bacterium]